jgi:hypothetical protein
MVTREKEGRAFKQHFHLEPWIKVSPPFIPEQIYGHSVYADAALATDIPLDGGTKRLVRRLVNTYQAQIDISDVSGYELHEGQMRALSSSVNLTRIDGLTRSVEYETMPHCTFEKSVSIGESSCSASCPCRKEPEIRLW